MIDSEIARWNPGGGCQLTKFPAPGVKNRLGSSGAKLALGIWAIVGGGACERSCGGDLNGPAREDPKAAEHARSIPVERVAYVSNNGSDSISLLDLEAPGNTSSVSLDFDRRREAPHHLAIDTAADRLYVAFAHPREAVAAGNPHAQHGRSAIAPGELVTLQRSTLRLLRRDPVDENPGDLLLGQDGRTLLVSHYDLGRAFDGARRGAPPRELYATLQVWDAKTGIKRAERAVCVAPHGIAMRRDASLALLACYGSDELALVDLRSPELATEKIPLGSAPGPLGAPRFGPYSVTLSADESFAVVAELEGKQLRVFDMHSRSFDDARRVELGARAMMPCFSPAGRLYLPLAAPDGLAKIDAASGSVLARTDLDATCMSPHVAACRADGRVLVVCEGDHVGPGAVVEVDPESLALRARWNVGVYPDALVFAH